MEIQDVNKRLVDLVEVALSADKTYVDGVDIDLLQTIVSLLITQERTIKKMQDVLKSLKDKQPLYVLFQKRGHNLSAGLCPTCEKYITNFTSTDRCLYCGQKVKWDD